ncbi:MAG: serine hydrolase domain-containing protein [Bacteroidota bacterium]
MVRSYKKYTQAALQNNNLSPKSTLLIITIIFFVSCQHSEKVTNNSLSEFRTTIDSLYHATIPSDGPGAAVLVSYKGEMLIGKGFGLRNLETNEPVTASTNFRIASVSKQFTALCILKLIDEGKLRLKDSVQKYLPYPIFKNMTIEQLINHTSGLPSFDDYFLNHWDRTRIVENKDVLDWLLTNPKLDFSPGEGLEYSNTAYLMLALIVERVSGMEFSAYAKKHIFHLLGMPSTNYYSLANPIIIPERAFCYEKDSTDSYEKVDGFFMNGIMGDGAVYTSINDYYNYDLALRKKKFLSETTQELLFKPSSTKKKNGQVRHYAMGWRVTDTTAYHTGGWIGANAFAIRYLNKPLTVVIFMNKNTLFTSGLVDKTLNLTQAYLNKNNQ